VRARIRFLKTTLSTPFVIVEPQFAHSQRLSSHPDEPPANPPTTLNLVLEPAILPTMPTDPPPPRDPAAAAPPPPAGAAAAAAAADVEDAPQSDGSKLKTFVNILRK
jgi:hypothetical protein